MSRIDIDAQPKETVQIRKREVRRRKEKRLLKLLAIIKMGFEQLFQNTKFSLPIPFHFWPWNIHFCKLPQVHIGTERIEQRDELN